MGRYTILYVGQTGDLSERFDDHHKGACFNRNGSTHIGIKPESVEKTRLAIETDLARNYNPVCND
ncbi:MAG: GIY-YIG nuclease family protein [Desulfobulbaceae bacterium]|nr:GIY-YIG nuclease family protein [Desulfobulbaceae bacterium]